MLQYLRIVLAFFAGAVLLCAQEKVEGKVFDASAAKETGLSGANVYWLNSPIGTITDDKGRFSIPFKKEFNQLVISFIGFKTDTLIINAPKTLTHGLQPSNQLDEVVVRQEREAVQKSFFGAQNVVTVNSAELLKAACCNLAESFETNPAIDVNFNDALSGTKQIQMLGLTSPYLLITQENIPMVRGASQAFGLTFTPGTWVESIQITKGPGSVVNGFESISGQINTELVKPTTDVPIFVNGYGNLNGRLELNTHFNARLTEKWSTGLYLHGNQRTVEVDNNDDGFLDAPISDQINVQNRWQYQDAAKGWVGFFNFRFLNDEKQLGQSNFNPDRPVAGVWGSEIDTRRFDTSVKLGYVFPELPFQNFGFQAAYSDHQQESYYGNNDYNIDHQSLYTNFIFNSIIGSTQHKFKTGLNFAYDGYQELVNTQDFNRVDRSAGLFFEYAYDNLETLSLKAGLRVDTHNRLGNFITPRLHLRYSPWQSGSLRASFGIGRRAANIFAENQQIFGSSRAIQLADTAGPVYGFEPEKATNFGLSLLQAFRLFDRKGNVSVDFYRTNFENQIVIDWENPRAVTFANLEGESYANSLQLELGYEVLPRLDVRAAYKYYDIKTQYQSGLLQKPLVAKNRFFANLGYTTAAKPNGAQWRLDYTLHTVGEQRLPSTLGNPPSLQLGEYVDGYALMNAQITRVFSKKFEVYLGGENLTAVTQDNPILGAADPFGPNFDTTIIYAPVLGRMVYAGFRFKS